MSTERTMHEHYYRRNGTGLPTKICLYTTYEQIKLASANRMALLMSRLLGPIGLHLKL